MNTAKLITPCSYNAGNHSGIFNGLLTVSKSQKASGQKGRKDVGFILLSLMQLKTKRMTGNFLRKPWLRIPFFMMLGILIRFPIDLAFGAVYRYYDLIRPWQDYLGALLLTTITLELVLRMKRLLNRRIPWEKGPARRLMLECLIITPAALTAIILLRILTNLFITRAGFIKFADEALTAVYYLMLLVLLPTFLEFALFLLHKWRTGLAEVERFRKENAEFRFEALRAQVNPHFLFNSLNTLSSLVYENQEKAALFIRHLADVYRYVLENRNRETIALADELAFITSFVYLYQLRFDNKLNISIAVDDALMQRLIAPMTLQLLIENAVKHNIVSAKKPLEIEIFTGEGDYLHVRNNLQKKQAEGGSTAMGLKNISSRYQFLTTRAVGIIESESTFIVKVPLI